MHTMDSLALAAPEICVVDDDPMVCEALKLILSLEGFRVTSFSEGETFLASLDDHWPAGVILDVFLPGRSGHDLLKELSARDCRVPVFMISGHADIAMAIEAIRMGAADFIEKPFAAASIVARLRERVNQSERTRLPGGNAFPGHDLLTPRERDVLAQIAGGASNKEAARRLRISPRTVEVHRAHIMSKLGARNAADLVRIVMSERAGLSPAPAA